MNFKRGIVVAFLMILALNLGFNNKNDRIIANSIGDIDDYIIDQYYVIEDC